MNKYIVIGGILLIFVLIMGSLYLRKMSQQEQIIATVDTFILAGRSSDSSALKEIVHPSALAGTEKFVAENKVLFTAIREVVERKGPFNYSWKSGVGETTEFFGDAKFSDGATADLSVQVIKSEGKWLVYGFEFSNFKEMKQGE